MVLPLVMHLSHENYIVLPYLSYHLVECRTIMTGKPLCPSTDAAGKELGNKAREHQAPEAICDIHDVDAISPGRFDTATDPEAEDFSATIT